MTVKYYKIADVTVEVRSDLPITEKTFHPKLKVFETNGPGEDMVVIHHHFEGLPDTPASERIYLSPPWAIYHRESQYVYDWIRPDPPHTNCLTKAITNRDHSHIDIHHDDIGKNEYLSGNLISLSMFPTDQVWFGHMLAFRKACVIHSLGAILNGNGFLFVGHSGAGKSTMAQMLMRGAEILCDDRNIVRKSGNHFNVYGTWSHGDVPDISSAFAPMRGFFFLEQSDHNEIIPIQDPSESLKILLACLIRPLTTDDWWNLSMDTLLAILKKVPCWRLKFDKSGEVLPLLEDFCATLPEE